MRRRHLIEIHEQPWCPAVVRHGTTDCLRAIAVIGRQFHGAIPLLRRVLAHTGSRRIVDLGSGGGGPWPALHRHLRTEAGEPIAITLTDLLPNRAAWEQARAQAPDQIAYVTRPVDATDVPAELTGVRTLCTIFHHFDPATAQAVLQDAVDAGQGIAVFEQTRRSLPAMLSMAVLAPIAYLAVLVDRPVRWSQVWWTFVVPVIPWVLLSDGVVSCWRTYTEAELQHMTDALDGPAYRWQIGRVRTPLSPLGLGYLIGYPAEPRVERTT